MTKHPKKKYKSVYLTAGFPQLDDTARQIRTLDSLGVNIIEIGMPYSDPLADGPVIQMTSQQALKNGMTMDLLFKQLASVSKEVAAELVYMGYYNQLLQYGISKFLLNAHQAGFTGVIIPDLPLGIYTDKYQGLFESAGIKIAFLVTPATRDERIKLADKYSSLFLYCVSNNTITGAESQREVTTKFLQRLQRLDLKSRKIVGFGIRAKEDVLHAFQYADGAIIGSAYLRYLDQNGLSEKVLTNFIEQKFPA